MVMPYCGIEEGNYEADSTALEHRVSAVSSKGGINATFRVPGTIAIPSDGAAHNVTVAQLDLDAVMSWVTVPKISAKAFVKVSFYLLYTSINLESLPSGQNQERFRIHSLAGISKCVR